MTKSSKRKNEIDQLPVGIPRTIDELDDQPRGVCLLNSGRWTTSFYDGTRSRSIGVFNTMQEARQAYEQACRMHGKEHLIDRKPLPQSKKAKMRRLKIMHAVALSQRLRDKNADGRAFVWTLEETIERMKEIQNKQHRRIREMESQIKELTSRLKNLDK